MNLLILTRPTRVRYAVLAFGCSVAIISYIHRVAFAVASPLLKSELSLRDEDLGLMMAASILAYGAFEVPGGYLADRFGVRYVLTALVLGWSLLTGCVALVVMLPAVWALRFGYLLVMRFLFGMFQAGGFPNLSRMLTDWTPPSNRASAQGLVWMSSRVGGAAIPLLLGPMFFWFGDWKAPMWLIAALGLIWCAAFWPWFRSRPEQMPQVNDAERALIAVGRQPRAAGHAHLPWGMLLRSRSVWGLFLMYAGGTFSATFFVTLLPDYLRHHRHLTSDQTNLLTSLPLMGGIVACLLGGMVSDRLVRRLGRKWGRRLNGIVGLAGAGVAILATIWVPDDSIGLLALLLCLTFFCNDVNMAPAWAACADLAEGYAGTLGGGMNMFGNVCAALAAAVTGYLLTRGDWQFGPPGFTLAGHDLLFVLFAASFFLGSVFWLLVDVTKPIVHALEMEASGE